MVKKLEAETTEKKISERDMKEIHSLINKIKTIQSQIGLITLNIEEIESQKQEVISEFKKVRDEIQAKCKECVIKAGISEEESESYTVDISKGVVVNRDALLKEENKNRK